MVSEGESHDETAPTPSWLTSPCPPWCTRRHREEDLPADRWHQDDGVALPLVLARVDEVTLRPVPYAADVVVRRVREPVEHAPTWVVVAEAEDAAHGWILSLESAAALRAALPADPR
jgi:hypothetical protein